MENFLISDTIVSLSAFVGLTLLISSIRRSDKNSLTRKFLFGLNVIAVMLAGRVIFWVTGIVLFDVINLIAAGMIPLATVLLTEALLRRHAPFFIKFVVAGFAVLFIPLVLIPSAALAPTVLYLLLFAQFFGFAAGAWLVITRDKSSLSSMENRIIERIALSLLLIIPFLATDFRTSAFELPVRLGGVAILGLCWLTISLERSHLNNVDMIRAFLTLIAGSVFAGLSIAWINDFSASGAFQAIIIVLSTTLVAVIYNDSVSLRFDERRNSLLKHLSEGNMNSSQEFLRGLQNHVLVDGALILNSDDLKDFDLCLLAQIFDKAPLQRLSEIGQKDLSVDANVEQLRWLFERFNATHVIVADAQPLTLVALNMPSLASSPEAEIELKAVQRMAHLISLSEQTA